MAVKHKLHFGDGGNFNALRTAFLPIALATVIEVGNLLSYESRLVVLMDDEAEDATFLGVALAESDNSQSENVLVMTAGFIDATLVSATYAYGAGLKYDNSADDGSLVADGNANTIAWIAGKEPGSSNVTNNLVWFNTMPGGGVLDKLFDIVSA